jgi:hypothetical protein
MGNPAELPEGGEGAGSSSAWRWWRWRGPNPAELPVDFTANALIAELLKLRGRVHLLENELTVAKLGRGRLGGGIGGPAELVPPELPAEIFPSEVAEIVPPEIAEIAEFPMPDAVVRAITELVDQRIALSTERILAEIGGLREEIRKLGKKR